MTSSKVGKNIPASRTKSSSVAPTPQNTPRNGDFFDRNRVIPNSRLDKTLRSLAFIMKLDEEITAKRSQLVAIVEKTERVPSEDLANCSFEDIPSYVIRHFKRAFELLDWETEREYPLPTLLPGFWLSALRGHKDIQSIFPIRSKNVSAHLDEVQPHRLTEDMLLHYIEDIRTSSDVPDPSFSVTFSFAPNPYIKNPDLTLKFTLTSVTPDDINLTNIVATPIVWQDESLAYIPNPNREYPYFLEMFTPPEIPKTEDALRTFTEGRERLIVVHKIFSAIRTKVAQEPYHYWYNGVQYEQLCLSSTSHVDVNNNGESNDATAEHTGEDYSLHNNANDRDMYYDREPGDDGEGSDATAKHTGEDYSLHNNANNRVMYYDREPGDNGEFDEDPLSSADSSQGDSDDFSEEDERHERQKGFSPIPPVHAVSSAARRTSTTQSRDAHRMRTPEESFEDEVPRHRVREGPRQADNDVTTRQPIRRTSGNFSRSAAYTSPHLENEVTRQFARHAVHDDTAADSLTAQDMNRRHVREPGRDNSYTTDTTRARQPDQYTTRGSTRDKNGFHPLEDTRGSTRDKNGSHPLEDTRGSTRNPPRDSLYDARRGDRRLQSYPDNIDERLPSKTRSNVSPTSEPNDYYSTRESTRTSSYTKGVHPAAVQTSSHSSGRVNSTTGNHPRTRSPK